MDDNPHLRIEVVGRPATFATKGEHPWREAVKAAIAAAGVQPEHRRFAVRIEFRLPAPRNANDAWDIDNLIKPTLDAMGGVFGTRVWKGPPQAADDRVEHIDARKRQVVEGEETGATIEVWRLG